MKKIVFIFLTFFSYAFFANSEEQKIEFPLRKPKEVSQTVKINRKYGFEIGINTGYVMDLTDKWELVLRSNPNAILVIDWKNFKQAPDAKFLNAISVGYHAGFRYNFNKNEFGSSFFATLAFSNSYLIPIDFSTQKDMSFGGYVDFGYIWRYDVFRFLLGVSSAVEYLIEHKSFNYFPMLKPLIGFGWSF